MLRLIAATLAVTVFGVVVHSTQAQEPSPEATPVREAPRLGDVDCDGRIDSLDAALILQLDVGILISDLCVEAGDINDDGTLNTIDAALVLQATAGLTSFPPTPPDPLPPPASGGISIGSAEAAPGREGTVDLEARAVTAPGLGAWTIDIEYDPAVVSVARCSPELGAVCNGEFAPGVLRISGASAGGLEGNTKLANLTFTCADVGEVSDLTLNPRVFADGTRGGPQPFEPTVTNGSITCTEKARGRLTVFVIHDLNGNGRRDPGEPGLEDWTVDLPEICGKLGFGEPQRTGVTDGEGKVVFPAFSYRCVVVESRFGWEFTAYGTQRTRIGPRETEATVLVRKVGQQLQQVTGTVIVDGLPATDFTRIEALVDGTSCEDIELRPGGFSSSYNLYVLGQEDRPGCANEGDDVEIRVDGVTVASVTFASGQADELSLIAGPAPMWFETAIAWGVDIPPVPYVGANICGEARRYQRFGFHTYMVYVFADALRSGCGAPGRVVTLIAGDEVLRHVAWQEGFVEGGSLRDVALPDTGGRWTESDKRYGWRSIVALVVFGLLLLAGGSVRRRVGRAG